MVMMLGDIDLRVFDVMDYILDVFGVNDNVFGVVGVFELVWVLLKYKFNGLIVYVVFFGEE